MDASLVRVGKLRGQRTFGGGRIRHFYRAPDAMATGPRESAPGGFFRPQKRDQPGMHILAMSAAFARLSTFQHRSMACRIVAAGRMPSARSVNFTSSALSVIGISR